jgi:EAL domain-containing protein (putative c-di-GMP-specific phosphodiesterase class I)
VNVSPSQLASPELWNQLATMIHTDSINPSKLTLEITESMEIRDVAAAAGHLAELRDLGVGISIDDFGTGHSSAEQVVQLPVSEVKIDRSLVQGTSDENRAEFQDAITLAVERNLRVVAEGIETEAQRDYAIDMGCHRGQGFLFGRPAWRIDLAGWR